jgi:hypothetical protein
MSTDRLTVMFCCNDDDGNLLDVVAAVEVDELIQLEGPIDFDDDELRATTPIAWTIRIVEVAGVAFPYHDRGRFAGNLCWDAVVMDKGEIVRLLNHLANLIGWSYLSAEASLAEVWGKREITADDLEGAMGI